STILPAPAKWSTGTVDRDVMPAGGGEAAARRRRGFAGAWSEEAARNEQTPQPRDRQPRQVRLKRSTRLRPPASGYVGRSPSAATAGGRRHAQQMTMAALKFAWTSNPSWHRLFHI